jgi:hypothetical protein
MALVHLSSENVRSVSGRCRGCSHLAHLMWVYENVIQLTRPLAVTMEVSQVTVKKTVSSRVHEREFGSANARAICAELLRKGTSGSATALEIALRYNTRDLTEGNEGEEGCGKNSNVGNSMPVSLAENLRSMSVAGHLSERAGGAVVVGVSGGVDT